MSSKLIKIARTGGPVIVNVRCPNSPQSIVGIVYRYAADQTKEGQIGQFKTATPNVQLGRPASIDGKLIGILTQVLPFNDDPPSAYKIVVNITQDDNILSSEVPSDNGSGTVSTDIITSLYYFSIQAI